MSLLGAPAPRVWGVRQLINYVGKAFANDPRLSDLGVRGEITGLSRPPSGHVYFGLKEPSGATIKCFVRSSYARALPDIQNGIEATAYGSLGVYPDRSELSLNVASVELGGAGKLAAVYERIKRKLEQEGLFDAARKRALPRFPFRIALVSSPGADGAKDFLGVVRAKAPAALVTVVATPVQGVGAAEQIAAALAAAGRFAPDVIALVRGGGSDEDRLPFNEESVARAIAAAKAPVITAIGHRADHHIADDVADCSAATPTAAAERLVEGFATVHAVIGEDVERMRKRVRRLLADALGRTAELAASPYLRSFDRAHNALAQRVDRLSADLGARQAAVIHRRSGVLRALERRLIENDPGVRLAQRLGRVQAGTAALQRAAAGRVARGQRRLDLAGRGLQPATAASLLRAGTRLAILSARLDGKDPAAILQQGYAIVRRDGRAIRDARELAAGEAVEAQLWRGTFRARVEETQGDG